MAASAATRLSIAVSVAVLAAKLVAWRVTGSVALFSDALESIVNVVAALGAHIAVRVSARPPDEDHPWGHEKAEYLSAVAEGALIAGAAVAIVSAAAERLLDPRPAGSLVLGLGISTAASVVNGLTGLFLVRKGRELGSPAVHADGVHLLTDVATTAGVLAGVALANATGFWLLDPLLAIAVAIHVVRSGWAIVRESVRGLMDEAIPGPERARIEEVAREAAGPAAVRITRARRAAQRTFVEMNVFVPGDTSVADAHALCDRIEDDVRGRLAGVEVVVHVEPAESIPPA